MNFFDDLGEVITSTGKNVVQRTKDLAELSRLASVLAAERAETERLYGEIGRLYYEQNHDCPGEEYLLLFGKTTASRLRAEKVEARMQRLKSLRSCPACGKEIPFESQYCMFCGEKSDPPQAEEEETPEEKCVSCGAVLPKEGMFCPFCGTAKNTPPSEEKDPSEGNEP